MSAGARHADAGQAATLAISVRKRDRSAVRKALRRRGSRTLALHLIARDSAGNERVVRRTFRLQKRR